MRNNGVGDFRYYVGINSLAEVATREDRVCVLNILGGESSEVTPVGHAYSGGNVVFGTSPGKKGQVLETPIGPIPVYNNVRDGLNAGQVYVPLTRLEKAGLISSERVGQADRPDRKVYRLTAPGRARLTEWLADTSWPKPAPAEFHLKLVVAAAAGLGDPVRIVDGQRHALLAELAGAQRAALAEPNDSVAGLLLEGVVLRLQADLRWLEACARYWSSTKE